MNIKKQLITMNYSKGITIVPQYIVIHETGNVSSGANAQMHYKYWNTNINAQSSVHFVVDDKEVIQLAELSWRCWHVGDNKRHSSIVNGNSIGIEICVNADGDYTKARQNAIELVKYLMPILKIDADHVVRHFDSSGKHCPATMLDKPELWVDFKNQLQPVMAYLEALKICCKEVGLDESYWTAKQDIDKYFDDLIIKFAKYINTKEIK